MGRICAVRRFALVWLTAWLMETAAAAPPGAGRLELRPLLSFDAHLYLGPFKQPAGICFDARHGEVLVADTANHRIGVFTAEGVPIFEFGGHELLQEPTDVLVDPEGRILVIDRGREDIKVFSHRGEFLERLQLPGLPAERVSLSAIHFDEEGNLYVGERQSGRIYKYDRALKLVLEFGWRGEGPGRFSSIHGIATGPQHIYVIDREGTAVQVFDHRGTYLRGWGRHDVGKQNFSLPQDVVVDSRGRILVVDGLRHDVKVFDGSGQLLALLGGQGLEPGKFLFPMGLAIDASDRLYVVEKVSGRVQVLQLEDHGRPRAELHLDGSGAGPSTGSR